LHKIFAKTSFLGKNNIFLPECHSTNDELGKIVQERRLKEGFVLYTDHQISGKGQRGNLWVDSPGDSILTSVYLKPTFLEIRKSFYLYMLSAVAILDAFEILPINSNELKIKWPNDIYLNSNKIAGILIENTIKNNCIVDSIIGIGLNVNQSSVPNNATSIRIECDRKYDRFEILENILLKLEYWYNVLKSADYLKLKDTYLDKMYWKDEVKPFRVKNEIKMGIIRGIGIDGSLAVEMESGLEYFHNKQIEFLQ